MIVNIVAKAISWLKFLSRTYRQTSERWDKSTRQARLDNELSSGSSYNATVFLSNSCAHKNYGRTIHFSPVYKVPIVILTDINLSPTGNPNDLQFLLVRDDSSWRYILLVFMANLITNITLYIKYNVYQGRTTLHDSTGLSHFTTIILHFTTGVIIHELWSLTSLQKWAGVFTLVLCLKTCSSMPMALDHLVCYEIVKTLLKMPEW